VVTLKCVPNVDPMAAGVSFALNCQSHRSGWEKAYMHLFTRGGMSDRPISGGLVGWVQ
jgi:hypothetical protein